VAPLGDEDLIRQHSRLMSPMVWDLGPRGALRVALAPPQASARARRRPHVKARDRPSTRSTTPSPRRDASAIGCAAVARADPSLHGGVRARRAEAARARSPAAIAATAAGDGFVVNWWRKHEAQHQETMLQAIALREDLPTRPCSWRRHAAARAAARPARDPRAGAARS
jgi:iron(II)-dependent oxidoreductase